MRIHTENGKTQFNTCSKQAELKQRNLCNVSAQVCRQAAQEEAIPFGGRGVPEVLSTFYLRCLTKEKLTNMNVSRKEQKSKKPQKCVT